MDLSTIDPLWLDISIGLASSVGIALVVALGKAVFRRKPDGLRRDISVDRREHKIPRREKRPVSVSKEVKRPDFGTTSGSGVRAPINYTSFTGNPFSRSDSLLKNVRKLTEDYATHQADTRSYTSPIVITNLMDKPLHIQTGGWFLRLSPLESREINGTVDRLLDSAPVQKLIVTRQLAISSREEDPRVALARAMKQQQTKYRKTDALIELEAMIAEQENNPAIKAADKVVAELARRTSS